MTCAPCFRTHVLPALFALMQVGACARTHLDGEPASAPVSTLPAAGRFAAAGKSAQAAGSGGVTDTTDRIAHAAGSGGARAQPPSPAAGSGARQDAGAANPYLLAADVPQLPLGIEVAASAILPEGLWVGETRSEQACAIEGGGVLPGSSRRVTIEIRRASSAGPAQGTVVFGDRQALPPMATDADAGYPLPNDHFDPLCRSNHASAGYPYPVRDGHMSADGRLDFRIAVVELYGAWCALQKSYPGDETHASETGYTCMPPVGIANFGICQSQPAQCPMSATKFEICKTSAICVCIADGCYVNLNRSYRIDLRWHDRAMTGLLVQDGSNESMPIEIKLRRAD